MNTIKPFLQIIGAIFSIFKKGQGEHPPPLLPANCAPDTSPDIPMHPKNDSTSQKNFK